MKPRNFPSRRRLRQLRAAARRANRPMPTGDPWVVDTRFRLGAKRRVLESAVPAPNKGFGKLTQFEHKYVQR